MTAQQSLLEAPNYASHNFPPPRDFQLVAHEALRQGRREGHKNQMIMAPTGAGKTYLGLNAIQQALVKGFRAVFVCDRTTLINQTSATSDRYGLWAHGIIQADNPKRDDRFPFQIASAQTLARRGWPEADLIVIDEAHTQLSVWTEHIMKTEASVIGLSATPFSKGLGQLFTNLVNAATMNELTRSGVLVPMRVFSCTRPDMTGAATSGGEWTDLAAQERGMEIVGDVVTEWVKFGEGRKTICFGSTIAHCEELCNQFVKAGIMASLFTSKTTDTEREQLLKEFSKPDSMLRVLISVEALAKGFDVPDVGCVIDCRPLRKSLSTAIQMWGRGLRSHPGKTDCILLDHSGNIIRFAQDYTEVFFNGLANLDMGQKLDSTVRLEPDLKSPPKGCPNCGFKPFFRRCMGCGFEIATAATVEHTPGSMQEITLGKGKVIDKQELYRQCVAYARANSVPEKQKGRAAYLYKDMVGNWPPNHWKPERVPADAVVSKEVANKIRSLNIRKAKSRVLPGVEA
jgi:DNA repair protein RadD